MYRQKNLEQLQVGTPGSPPDCFGIIVYHRRRHRCLPLMSTIDVHHRSLPSKFAIDVYHLCRHMFSLDVEQPLGEDLGGGGATLSAPSSPGLDRTRSLCMNALFVWETLKYMLSDNLTRILAG